MSKGGSDVTVQTYYADIHFVACYGPIDKITKIFVDGRLAYEGDIVDGTISINKPDLFGGEQREGGIVGDVDIMFGGSTQTANTYLTSKLGTIPAYRKVVSLILKNVLLGQNYYLKPWTIEAERIHVLEDGDPQWYDTYSEIESSYGLNFSYISHVGTTATVHTYKGHGVNTTSTITVSGANQSQYNTTFNPTNITQTTFDYTLSSDPGADATGTIFIGNKITGLINAVHVIRECFTNPTWGYGYSEALFPASVWEAAALTCYNEGLGFGFFKKTSETLDKFINDVKEHINAEVYQSRTDGKMYITLIRKLADTSSLLTLTEDSIIKVSGIDRKTIDDLASSYTIRFTDNISGDSNSATVRDLALHGRQTIPKQITKTYAGIADLATAYKVALRDHATLRTPLFSFKIECDRTAENLNKGDAFKVTYDDYFNATLVMRVLTIDLGTPTDNKITIECIEDTFEAAGLTYQALPQSKWVTPLNDPIAPSDRLLIEAPYYEIAIREGDTYASSVDTTVTFIAVAAGKPIMDSISAGIWSTTSTDYTRKGVVDFCFVALTVNSLSKTSTTITVNSMSNDYLLSEGKYIQIDNELIGIVSISGNDLTVIRGVCDTVPEEHSIGATVFGLQDNSSSDGEQYLLSETVYVKLTTITPEGELDIADAAIDNITVIGRMHLPYPPGNMQINSTYWPTSISLADLAVTWAHRNRFQQTAGLIEYYTGTITSESSVTYSGELIRTDTSAVLLNFTGETGETYTFNTLVSLPGNVTSITRSGTTASVTMDTAHGLTTGRAVKISGATDALYNGNFIITVTSSTTFDYTMSGTPAADASGTLVAEANIYDGEVQLNLWSVNPNGDSYQTVSNIMTLGV